MYMSPTEAEHFKEMIERVTKPLKDRIEALEKLGTSQQFGSSPVGWGGHLPGKIEP
jgi:hypothetical protein